MNSLGLACNSMVHFFLEWNIMSQALNKRSELKRRLFSSPATSGNWGWPLGDWSRDRIGSVPKSWRNRQLGQLGWPPPSPPPPSPSLLTCHRKHYCGGGLIFGNWKRTPSKTSPLLLEQTTSILSISTHYPVGQWV